MTKASSKSASAGSHSLSAGVALAAAALSCATPQARAQKAREDVNAIPKYKLLNVSKDPKRALAGDYVLDSHHTSVTAKLAHMDLSRYTLRFDDVKGRFSYDPVNPAATRIEITIDPNSIDTGDTGFDKQIAGRYLESAKFPAITFTTTNIKIEGDHGEVAGVLDFHGAKKPVVLHTIYRGFTSLDNQPRMGFSAEATFKRSDFGVGIWAPLEADEVLVLIETEFIKA